MGSRSDKRLRRRGRLCLLAALLTAAFLAAAATPAFAYIDDPSASPNHQAVLERSGTDYAKDIAIVGSFVYVCGQVDAGAAGADASLLRMSTRGDALDLWTSGISGRDHANAMAVAPGGTAVYTSGSRQTATNADILVIKWARSGRVIWKRLYNATPRGHDAGSDVVVDHKGNVTVLGVAAADTVSDWVVVRWAANGTRRWARRLTNSPDEDAPAELVVDRAGNIYATGYAMRNGHSAMLTVKLSLAGNVLWKKWYLGAAGVSGAGHTLARCPDGGVYVGGLVANESRGHSAVCLRYAAGGRQSSLDPVTLGGATVSLSDLAVLTSGRIVGVGWLAAPGLATEPFFCSWAPDGEVTVPAVIASPYSDVAVAVAADAYDGYCWVQTFAVAAGASIVVHRRSMDGAAWSWRWDGPTASSLTRPTAVATKGNVTVACGNCASAATGTDQFVMVWRY